VTPRYGRVKLLREEIGIVQYALLSGEPFGSRRLRASLLHTFDCYGLFDGFRLS